MKGPLILASAVWLSMLPLAPIRCDPPDAEQAPRFQQIHAEMQQGFTLRAEGEVVSLVRVEARDPAQPIDPRMQGRDLVVHEYPPDERPRTTLSLVLVRSGDRQYIEVRPHNADERQRWEDYAAHAEFLIRAGADKLKLDHRRRELIHEDARRLEASQPPTLPSPHFAVLAAFAAEPEGWISLIANPEGLTVEPAYANVETEAALTRVHEAYTTPDGRRSFERVVEYSAEFANLPTSVRLVRNGVEAGGTWTFTWRAGAREDQLSAMGHHLERVSGTTVAALVPSDPPVPSRTVSFDIQQFRVGHPDPNDPAVKGGKLEDLELPTGYEYSDRRAATRERARSSAP